MIIRNKGFLKMYFRSPSPCPLDDLHATDYIALYPSLQQQPHVGQTSMQTVRTIEADLAVQSEL